MTDRTKMLRVNPETFYRVARPFVRAGALSAKFMQAVFGYKTDDSEKTSSFYVITAISTAMLGGCAFIGKLPADIYDYMGISYAENFRIYSVEKNFLAGAVTMPLAWLTIKWGAKGVMHSARGVFNTARAMRNTYKAGAAEAVNSKTVPALEASQVEPIKLVRDQNGTFVPAMK